MLQILISVWDQISDVTDESVTFQTLQSAVSFRLKWALRYSVEPDEFLSLVTIEILKLGQEATSPIQANHIRRATDRALEKIRNGIKKLHRHVSLPSDLENTEQAAEPETTFNSDFVDRIKSIISIHLSSQEIMHLELLLDGASTKTLSEMMGSSESYTRMRKHRLIAKVRRILEAEKIVDPESNE